MESDERREEVGPARQPQDSASTLDALRLEEADVEAPTPAVVRRGGTFESFRHRDFSLFWFGALASNIGSWMQQYAIGIVVFALRQSSFDLGFVTFLAGIPVLFLALPGGALADRIDRRKLLLAIQLVLIAQAAALGYLYTSGRLSPAIPISSLAWMALLGIVGGALNAVQFPAWQAMLPDLVPRESLLNGIALNSAQFQSSRLLGPLAAGALVVAGAGMGEIFYVNAASFLFVITALGLIRPRALAAEATPPHTASNRRGGTWSALVAGLSYARENRAVGVLLLSTAVMTVFGFPYMTLLPAIVSKTLGHATNSNGYTQVTAFIMAANGLGAMVGALGVASLSHMMRPRRIIPFSLLSFGVLLGVFGLLRSLIPMLIVSALAGGALMTTNSLANTSIQADAPGRLRGRVMALFVMAFIGIMPISGLVFGGIGQLIGPSNAVVAGAVILIGWALFLVARPHLLEAPPSAPEPDRS